MTSLTFTVSGDYRTPLLLNLFIFLRVIFFNRVLFSVIRCRDLQRSTGIGKVDDINAYAKVSSSLVQMFYLQANRRRFGTSKLGNKCLFGSSIKKYYFFYSFC